MIGAETARLTKKPDAMDFILRGRAAFLKPLSRDAFTEAIERGLALDPGSVEARASLAGSLAGRVMGSQGA